MLMVELPFILTAKVELPATDRRGGRPIQWTDTVRLKSVALGLFMCVSSASALVLGSSAEGGVSEAMHLSELTTANQDEDSPAGISSEPILFTSPFYLSHLGETAPLWLHVDHDTSQVRAATYNIPLLPLVCQLRAHMRRLLMASSTIHLRAFLWQLSK